MAIRRPDESDRESAAELRRRLAEQRQTDRAQSREEQARVERARATRRTQRGDDVTIARQARERLVAAQNERAGQPPSAAGTARAFSRPDSQCVSRAQPVRTPSAIAARPPDQTDREPGLRFNPEVTARLREAAERREARTPTGQQPGAGTQTQLAQQSQPVPQAPAGQATPPPATQPAGERFIQIRRADGTTERLTPAQFEARQRQRARQTEQQNARGAEQELQGRQGTAQQTANPPGVTINFDALSRAFGGGQQGQDGAPPAEDGAANQGTPTVTRQPPEGRQPTQGTPRFSSREEAEAFRQQRLRQAEGEGPGI